MSWNQRRPQMQSTPRFTIEVDDYHQAAAGQYSDVARAPVIDGGGRYDQRLSYSPRNHRNEPVVDGGGSYDQRFPGVYSPRNHRTEPMVDGSSSYDQRYSGMNKPRNHRPEPSSSSFLKNCGLCNSRLAPTRDAYMYNDGAYCSEECKEQQIELDEGKTQNEDVRPPSNYFGFDL